ncbi:hypothetical protein [Inquilinus limosus]|uniref:Uncharacterized protein n=1 Tax=Inquilinus limosus MP06 TaxID=1398085 RepID=A0A0A0DDM0_9PROT|nr:hypothetical protein [Inquilinus limosus]KGM36140.1 hypothetical protein P409_00395 [Inquilinus limosus MP06]
MSNVASLRTPLAIAQDSIVKGLETLLAEAKEGKIEGVLAFVFNKEGDYDVFEITPTIPETNLVGVLEVHKTQIAISAASDEE